MKVSTMKEDEVLDQIDDEYKEVIKVFFCKCDKVEKWKKRNYVKPCVIYGKYTSKAKNKYLFQFDVESRSITKSMLFCVANKNDGIYLYRIDPLSHALFVFVPHFFRRYKERTESDLFGEDLMKHFIGRNAAMHIELKYFTLNVEERNPCYGTCRDGVAVGEVIDGVCMFKSFITHEMKTKSQNDKYVKTDKIKGKIKEK